MKKLILVTVLAFTGHLYLNAQPQPCGTNPAMTSTCMPACIICDIDGFTGINNSQVTGQAPPGFCTSEIHHMQWIGFIAGSTNLTLEVHVFNCQFNEGLEIGIYEGIDCQNFQLVSNCDTDVSENQTGVFTNTVPLTVGQYYYFVMDGSQDDVCQYTIEVTNGTTEVPPLSGSGEIEGPDLVCQGTPSQFTLQAPTGAAHFEWTLDGAYIDQGQTVLVGWPTLGEHELCATASNACDVAAPTCRTVMVYPTATTNLTASLCSGDCFEAADTMLCTPGIYDFILSTTDGCDSFVHVVITGLPASVTDLDVLLCDGDSIFVGAQPYFQSGQFQQVLTAANGCDSTVNLALQVIECEIDGALTTTPSPCAGQAGGAFALTVANGTPPFTYSWQRLGNGQPSGTGSIASLTALTSVPNLPAGQYAVTVSDGFGNDAVFFTTVTEPPALELATQLSQYHGLNISCPGLNDGTLALTASGGTPPYSVTWENGATTFSRQDLAAGPYAATVTDDAGCTQTVAPELLEAPPLALTAVFSDPTCDGPATGTAEAAAMEGGVPPYLFALSGGSFAAETRFTGLTGGLQTLTVRDANGCEQKIDTTLVVPLIPTVDAGPDVTIELADSAALHPIFDIPLGQQMYAWSGGAGLSCYDCAEPFAMPYETTTYVLTVTAPGGCTASDALTLHVELKRDVYVPNSFSPNDDGINDYFAVYGGAEVLRVRHLDVYSRWGELVFQRNDFEPNYESRGWNGFYRGKVLPPGVFAWVAEIEFVDGFTALYKGDVLLVR
jgi:gliding motility-associated-like protein